MVSVHFLIVLLLLLCVSVLVWLAVVDGGRGGANSKVSE
jgi:hypothetical protein